MYDKITSVMTWVRVTEDFPLNICLHQGLSLSLYLFTLVYVLIGYIQYTLSKYMDFTDDIVLIEESQVEVNCKLEVWMEALESKDFHLSKSKIKYMEWKFNSG